jgi:hypothetical protein
MNLIVNLIWFDHRTLSSTLLEKSVATRSDVIIVSSSQKIFFITRTQKTQIFSASSLRAAPQQARVRVASIRPPDQHGEAARCRGYRLTAYSTPVIYCVVGAVQIQELIISPILSLIRLIFHCRDPVYIPSPPLPWYRGNEHRDRQFFCFRLVC